MTRDDYQQLAELFNAQMIINQKIEKKRAEIVDSLNKGEKPYSQQDVLDYITMSAVECSIDTVRCAVDAVLTALEDCMPKEGDE